MKEDKVRDVYNHCKECKKKNATLTRGVCKECYAKIYKENLK